MTAPRPTRRVGRALVALELAAIGAGTAAGLAVSGTHPTAAIIVAAIAAFLALVAIAAALTPGD